MNNSYKHCISKCMFFTLCRGHFMYVCFISGMMEFSLFGIPYVSILFESWDACITFETLMTQHEKSYCVWSGYRILQELSQFHLLLKSKTLKLGSKLICTCAHAYVLNDY